LDYFARLIRFAVTGIAASARGVTGAEGVLGVAGALFVAFLIAWDVQRKREPWQIGMIAGILFFFTLVASGRVQFGNDFAYQTRYVYVGVAFLMPLVAHALRGIPWRGLWRPALLATVAVCMLGNAVQLQAKAVSLREYMRTTNAELQTVEVFRGAPDMAVDHYIDSTVISSMYANVYFEAIDELGSPVTPATTETLLQLPSYAVDRVMVNLFGDALTFKTDFSRSIEKMSCRDVDSTSGATIDFLVPKGQSVMLQSTKGGEALLFLGFAAPPHPDPLHRVQLPPATPGWVHVPDTGKPIVWQLQIKTGSVGMVRVCIPN
jgi:hypothetical protein